MIRERNFQQERRRKAGKVPLPVLVKGEEPSQQVQRGHLENFNPILHKKPSKKRKLNEIDDLFATAKIQPPVIHGDSTLVKEGQAGKKLKKVKVGLSDPNFDLQD